MHVFSGLTLTHKAAAAALVAVLAAGASVGAFASQDMLPGNGPSQQTVTTPTPRPHDGVDATEQPDANGTPRAIKGIPTENPQHHPDDGDGVCEQGETAVKTTPAGVQVNVPCQAAERSGASQGDSPGERDATPHADGPDDEGTPEAGDNGHGRPDASETPEPDTQP